MQNKILSMAASLPNRMARKHWCLSDYSIVRKLYTGYASTVYQVRQGRALWGLCTAARLLVQLRHIVHHLCAVYAVTTGQAQR